MTLYEFLTTAFSILIAVTIVRLLDGLISIIRSGNAFSIHLVWIVAGILGALVYWWALWSFSTLYWTFGLFLLAILGTMILYSLAVILVPPNYENVVDWKAYYYKSSRFYLLLQIVSGIQILALNELGDSQMARYFWIIAGITWIFFISAAFNQNEKLHYFVAYVVGLGFALGSIMVVLFTTDINLVN